MNKVVALKKEEKNEVWGKAVQTVKVMKGIINGTFFNDLWKTYFLSGKYRRNEYLINAPPRQFFLRSYYDKFLNNLIDLDYKKATAKVLLLEPAPDKASSEIRHQVILEWFSQKCIHNTDDAVLDLPNFVRCGYFNQEESCQLKNILTCNVDEISTNAITENVAKIADVFIRSRLCITDIGTLLIIQRSNKDPLLSLVAKIRSKLNLSAILGAIDSRSDQVGRFLASLPDEQSAQILKDLTTIGYFSDKGKEMVEAIRSYADFDLTDIQDEQKRTKVAAIAVYFLVERLRISSKEKTEKTDLPKISKVFQQLKSYIPCLLLPWIIEEVLDIFPRDIASVQTIVNSLDSLSSAHISELLRIAKKIEFSDYYMNDVKNVPFGLLRNNSVKPTLEQLDSFLSILKFDNYKTELVGIVIELIGRMNPDERKTIIPDLIEFVPDNIMDRMKMLLQTIGVPLEKDREKIRGYLNSANKKYNTVELAALCLSRMMPISNEDIHAITGLRNGSKRMKIVCMQSLSSMNLRKNSLVFDTLKQLAIGSDKTVGELALEELLYLGYISEKEKSTARTLLINDSAKMSDINITIVNKSRFLKEIVAYLQVRS